MRILKTNKVLIASFLMWQASNAELDWKPVAGGGLGINDDISSFILNGNDAFLGKSPGLIRSSDAINWSQANCSDTIKYLAVNSQYIYGASFGKIIRTDINGSSCEAMDIDYLSGQWIRSMAASGDLVFISAFGNEFGKKGSMSVSFDNGTSWAKLDTGQGWQNNGADLKISGTRLIAGHHFGIHISDDSGSTWIETLGECDIIKVEKYRDTLYAVGGKFIPPPNPVQKCLVFRSLDGGNTWEKNENTLAQFPANRMCIYNGNIFISVQSKIFRADLDVDNWVDLQWAYEEPVHEMGFSVSGLFVFNDKMYAATDKGLDATVLDNPTGPK